MGGSRPLEDCVEYGTRCFQDVGKCYRIALDLGISYTSLSGHKGIRCTLFLKLRTVKCATASLGPPDTCYFIAPLGLPSRECELYLRKTFQGAGLRH